MSETTNEKIQRLIVETKVIMPPSFIINVGDERIRAFMDMVLGDINLFLPVTGYTVADMPPQWEPMVKYGTQVFSMMFLQAQYSLQDFDWNDNGLSIRLDRVQKLEAGMKNILEFYKQMVLNAKKAEVLRVAGKGIGTPKYQSQIGQFLKISLGGSFTWNSPN